mgnify:CR=1 FL=1
MTALQQRTMELVNHLMEEGHDFNIFKKLALQLTLEAFMYIFSLLKPNVATAVLMYGMYFHHPLRMNGEKKFLLLHIIGENL